MARICRLNPDLTTITTCTTTNSEERDESEEMDRPGGLVAAEEAQQERRAAVTAGDIVRPVSDHQRCRHEHHERVRALLQQAVARAAASPAES